MKIKLKESIFRLQAYIEKNQYRGYDRYDGLMSPIFRHSYLKNRKIRFFSQQIIRRLPINLRWLLRVQKGYNPVTLGLVLQGYAYLQRLSETAKMEYAQKTEFLLSELLSLQSKGFSGICWGYDFDWEARYASIPAFTPTIVATGIITNGLFESVTPQNREQINSILLDSTKFILCDINRVKHKTGFCFSYSPNDEQSVFNATMKGARLLSQVYSFTGDAELKALAKETIAFVMQFQDAEGKWAYSLSSGHNWVDNYHTAYILDCLKAYSENTNDTCYDQNLKIGFEFYKNNFFHDLTIPKTYSTSLYPLDSTAIAQSIITLVNFGELEMAVNVANWVIDNFQDRDGHIYYRKSKFYTQKISYMRWSNAWMFAALTKLLLQLS